MRATKRISRRRWAIAGVGTLGVLALLALGAKRWTTETHGVTDSGDQVLVEAALLELSPEAYRRFAEDHAEGGAPGAPSRIFPEQAMPLLMQALEYAEQALILQLPAVVTADGEEAVIEVTDEPEVPDDAGKTEEADIGIAETRLVISTRISEDDSLELDVEAVVTTRTGTTQPTHRLETRVTVPNRQTAVIDHSPAPARDGYSGRRLLLFLTPTIISDPAMLEDEMNRHFAPGLQTKTPR